MSCGEAAKIIAQTLEGSRPHPCAGLRLEEEPNRFREGDARGLPPMLLKPAPRRVEYRNAVRIQKSSGFGERFRIAGTKLGCAPAGGNKSVAQSVRFHLRFHLSPEAFPVALPVHRPDDLMGIVWTARGGIVTVDRNGGGEF